MKKFFAKRNNDRFEFEDEELNHFNVLRCRIGEQILCLGDDGYDYLCEVDQIGKKKATAVIVSKTINTKNPRKNITVFQALVKGEKADLITQKLTELGVSKLVMFESKFAIAKANNNKISRLNKISEEACKQCGRSIPLEISENISFEEMINQLKCYDVVLFANEKSTDRIEADLKQSQNVAIIVGSEGGFDDDEIQKIVDAGAKEFGLGARILRAETACIAMSAIVGYIMDV